MYKEIFMRGSHSLKLILISPIINQFTNRYLSGQKNYAYTDESNDLFSIVHHIHCEFILWFSHIQSYLYTTKNKN